MKRFPVRAGAFLIVKTSTSVGRTAKNIRVCLLSCKRARNAFALIRGFNMPIVTANLRELKGMWVASLASIRGFDVPIVTANLRE